MTDVSIITTCYNHKRFLESLFNGVMGQDKSLKIQWTIVDDGSTDGSREEIFTLSKLLPPNVDLTVISNLQNQGPFESLIRAGSIEQRGRYTTILEADDYWRKDFLAETVSFLDNNPSFVAVHTDTDYINVDQNTVEFSHWKTSGRYDDYGNHYDSIPSGRVFEELVKNNFIMTCSFIAKTSAFAQYNKVKAFSLPPYEYSFTDYPFYLGLARFNNIGYIDKSLAVYRVHSSSASNNPEKRSKVISDTQRMKNDAIIGRL